MKKLCLISQCVAIFVLTVLRYVETLTSSDHVLIQYFATLVTGKRFWIALIAAIYISVYTLWPKWLKPHREKKKLVRNLLVRVNGELFSGNENDHRITLFKEISWLRAFLRNCWHFIYHLFRVKGKRMLYLKPPKLGRYLIVNSRCGRRFKKSSTMFRVEMNNEEDCEGIVGLVRHKGLSVHKYDLKHVSVLELL